MSKKQLVAFGNFLYERMGATEKRVTDADFDQFEHLTGEPIKELPSGKQVDDPCIVSFGKGMVCESAKIIKVHFGYGNVPSYDIEMTLNYHDGYNTDETYKARLYNVDSTFVS